MSGPDSESDPPSEDRDDPKKPQKSGRVTFDSRGNAVWEWQVKTGVYGRELQTGKLEQLKSGLEIAEDPLATQKRQQKAAENERERGFDPYNASVASAPPPAHPRRALAPSPRREEQKNPTEQPRKRGFLARLFGRR